MGSAWKLPPSCAVSKVSAGPGYTIWAGKSTCYRAAAIHGDMDQHSRMAVLHAYKAGKHHVLVATDVAARGLDIKSIKSVVNYDAAKEVDTHVHRIGRTGRAGDKEGIAYTLITPYETRFAGETPQHMSWQLERITGALLTAEVSAELCQADPCHASLVWALLLHHQWHVTAHSRSVLANRAAECLHQVL